MFNNRNIAQNMAQSMASHLRGMFGGPGGVFFQGHSLNGRVCSCYKKLIIFQGKNELKVKLKAYSEAFLGKPELNLSNGDKIILPPSLLQELLEIYSEDALPYPTIFKIKSDLKVSHCGVLEYTSPDPSAAYLPVWMMSNLLIEDGSEIEITLVTLPKVTFVKFQPDFYEFTKIPDPKTTLEYALRNFTCLTKGDCISLTNNNIHHPLTVTDLLCDSQSTSEEYLAAGCVIDTNLEVDFDAPVENEPDNIFVLLSLNENISGIVKRDQYSYFHVRLSSDQQSLVLNLKTVTGDPVIYVSTSNDKPTADSNTWRLIGTKSKLQTLTIASSHPNYSSYFYIGVHAYGSDCEFELNATTSGGDLVEQKTSGYVVGNSNNSNESGSVCDNCKQLVPSATLMIHSAQCTRNNWFCSECRKVFPKKSKDQHIHCPNCQVGLDACDLNKHIDLFHRKVKCECGLEFESDLIDLHKSEECVFRKENCKWCNLLIAVNSKAVHEDYCANKSVECVVCHELVPRSKMDIHRAAVHRINPCVDSKGNRFKKGDEIPVSSADDEFERALEASRNDFSKSGVNSDSREIYDVDDDEDWSAPPENDEDMLQAAIRASLEETVETTSSSNTSNKTLKRHANAISSQPIDLTNSANNFTCPICSSVFSNAQALQVHTDICIYSIED